LKLEQNYLALDLELNLDASGNPKKIIQVGIAIGNPGNIKDIKTYSWYINPQEPIVPYITELTGITDDDVQNKSTPIDKVAAEIGQLIDANNVFVNPVQWGMGDADELKAEFRNSGVEFPYFGNRAIDAKTIYTFLQAVKGNSVKGGLRSCMGRYKLSFKGEPHRADVDAYNTLVFYFTLLMRQSKLEQLVESAKNIL
jgi:ATP-dependent DNA helicase DinG